MNFKTISMLVIGSLASASAFGVTCTGGGYTYRGNQHGGEFSGGQYYQGANAEKIVMQKGYEEDAGSDMGLASDDGLVSIDFNQNNTVTATVFVTRQNGSAKNIVLQCE